jgi:cytochrome c oxidase assembly protein subunit 15
MRRWRRHTELGVAYRRRDAEVHDVSLVCFYYFPFMAVEKDNLEVALQPVEYNRRLHRVALIVAWAIFPLIFIGGLVTSKDAGLSVPDWPNSYGYNMFAFPMRLWTGNIFYEHTHRLYASFVGLLTIVLAVAAFTDKRRWVRWLGLSCLGMVILQGVLGGLRVVLLKLNLAIVHACIAQLYFCLVMLMCVVTSRWWARAGQEQDTVDRNGKGLVKLAVVAWVVIFAQLMVGATMRHYRAGLAIPDLPLAYGRLIPPTNSADLEAAQQAMVPAQQWYDVNDSSLGQVWLAFGHRIGALLVTIAVVMLAACVLRWHRRRGLIVPAYALLVLLCVQITLGVLTVLWKKPADIASAHVAVGALVLMTTFVVAVRSLRLYSPAASLLRGFEIVPGDSHEGKLVTP